MSLFPVSFEKEDQLAQRLNQPERGQAWWLEVEPQPVNEHAAS